MRRLRQVLTRIDGRGYGAYKELRGAYDFEGWRLHVEHVQGDPFAAPSRLRVEIEPEYAGFGESDLRPFVRRIATEDFLTRAFAAALSRRRSPRVGSGKSGRFDVVRCGQEILERTACEIGDRGTVTFRFTLGLPAAGRRVLGRAALALLCEDLPRLVDGALRRGSLDAEALATHQDVAEDQEALRTALAERGLVAFVADGSTLPRATGATDEPMRGEVVPFEAPESLAVRLDAPHAGAIRGLGVGRGVTLIVGGGYHGKSTLLEAIARCVYPHIPGDGRERCVTDAGAVVIRAEDGRAVSGVDIRAFIDGLPLGRDTAAFTTADASGSTSQAAAIVEAREAGATALLIDEDTAATNFMVRDRRMRRLVPDESEPITPFVDRVRELSERGLSTVLVVGGAGDYLDVADRVIRMDAYRPLDVTARAREIARELPARDDGDRPSPFEDPAPRRPRLGSLNPRGRRGRDRVKSVRTRDIVFGEEEIDVSALEQLVDPAQARAIGDALLFAARELVDGRRSVAEILDALEDLIDEEGLSAILARPAGDRARPRRHEIAAALNRLRSLEVR